MSKHKWKPGDVAMVDGPGERLPITFYERDGALLFSNGHGYSYPIRTLASTARPLVVIDPEDREQVEHLAKFYRDVHGEAELTDEPWSVPGLRMQAALREFTNPTVKPEEPTGLGAVVEDAESKFWIRTSAPGDDADDLNKPWYRRGVRRNWQIVDAVKVLSDGIPA